MDKRGNLLKALSQLVYEFNRHKIIKGNKSIDSSQDENLDLSISEYANYNNLRQANRRWIICLSNDIIDADASGLDLYSIAEQFVIHQVNIVLICFKPTQIESKSAENFLMQIKILSQDSIVPIDAHLLVDPTPIEVEQLMMKRVSNYKKAKNAPLIIETFA